jgi:hypothetical protein
VGITKAITKMICAVEGGWDVAAFRLDMSLAALQNRVYGKKGSVLSVETALALQHISHTKHFAEAVAVESGGVFVTLPEVSECPDNEELLAKFLSLTTHYGALAKRHQEATADGEVDDREMADLRRIGNQIHQTVEEINALTERIYMRSAPKVRAGSAS